jgi:uncharacterized membrane protein
MNKLNRFLERFWMVVATLATLGSIVIAFLDGFYYSLPFFLLSGIAWGIYLVKVGIRKRMEILEKTPKGTPNKNKKK